MTRKILSLKDKKNEEPKQVNKVAKDLKHDDPKNVF
jgi:transcription termination factor Rho